MFIIPDKELEFEIVINLIEELVTMQDFDNNSSIFMREFTFFDHTCDHILNSYRYNMEDFIKGARRKDRFSISFFDYAEWYWNTFHNSNNTNNPDNYERYYCSKNTGPGWKICRDVAGLSVGSRRSKEEGPIVGIAEKVSDHLIKYTETDNGLLVPLNHGAGCFYWEFNYEKV